MRYIVQAFKRENNVKPKEKIDQERLEAFARDYRCRGEKLVAADTVWRMNDRYYGQWLALNVPFRRLEDFQDDEVERRVPDRYRHLATALRRCSAYWREAGLERAIDDMKLEAVNRTQIDTVVAMIRARTHLIDKYLAGHLQKDEVATGAEGDGAAGGVEARHSTTEEAPLEYDPKQEIFEAHGKECIDKAIVIQTAEDNDEAEKVAQSNRERAKPFVVEGPPGSGKTRRAKRLVRYALSKGGKAAFTFPTGQQQSRLRAELEAEGLQVDVDTCHGAFALHKKEQDAHPILDDYAIVVVDEFPQLSRQHFDRIVRAWDNAGRVPMLLFLGDFNQLPGIEGTNAKQSAYWKRLHRVRFDKCWRSGDETLLGKLQKLRTQVPTRRVRNTILRGHKAWSQAGGPTANDLRKLYRKTGGQTTIVTCTRKAAQQVNELAAEVQVGKRRALVELPGDFDANVENYDEHGKLRKDRPPLPSKVVIKKDLRLHLTRNLDKAGDFVNGMDCVVKAWDEGSRCLHVETVTGKRVAVHQYTDPNPDAQNASLYPVRLGYASTIYKMQGAELPHVTIYLDIPGQRAAAYVAMSRVKTNDDYLFGGHYTRKHFVPNA